MQPHPSTAYLRLAEGPEDLLGIERSLTRRVLTLFVAFVLLSGTSLLATAALDLDQGLIGKALAANSKASHEGGGDNSGPGGGDGDDADDDDTGTDSPGTQGDDSSHGQQATDSNSDDNANGASDSSKAQQSDDSNSDDNRDGNSDSSRGASVSMRSHATSDGRGDHTRG